MRKLVTLVLAAVLAPAAWAKVWTTVYCWDGVTSLEAIDPNHPTVYRDITVGTKLAIVISSDKGEYWFGGLTLSREDGACAELSGRGCSPPVLGSSECTGSCLAAAGKRALASSFSDPWSLGFYFNTSPAPTSSPVAGDWFVVDYRAEQVGTCQVRLYYYFASFDVPIQDLFFTHVPTRDFNGDAVVDFEDFALLTVHWNSLVDAEGSGAAFDLNSDGRIDLGDLVLFSEYWLERTDCPSGY
jgi:hypothetical protein